jgi:N-acetyl-anhydromuramyl-L-alanine amidase AmpD
VGAGTLDDDLRDVEAHPVIGIHWMIGRDGTVRRSIPEDQVAHHVFTYSGRSIAIELVNEGDGIDPFPEPQLAALVSLLRDIRERHRIPRSGLKRHSDLDLGRLPCDPSQRRKVDPGRAFPIESVIERVWGPGSPPHR